MIEATAFVEAAQRIGIGLWTGVPCSYLQPFINHVIGDAASRYVPASNEGDAVAIAAGCELGGGLAIAMFQNSGLGNAVNPLTSLAMTHRIPMLLVVTLRGEPGGAPDEPQHELMGSITTRMLELIGIRWEYFPTRMEEVEPCLSRAASWMANERLPYALVMQKGAVAPMPPPPHIEARPPKAQPTRSLRSTVTATRLDVIEAVQSTVGERDVVLATTGYTGRELYALAERPGQLALVGAMGCASSVGLGLALERPDLRVIVLDGDGAALMRLGALPTIGYQRPRSLLHILLDNGIHESTGGQSTVSRSVDLAAIAAASGYQDVLVTDYPAAIAARVRSGTSSLTFIQASIGPGTMADLPRPTISPPRATERLKAAIGGIVTAPR